MRKPVIAKNWKSIDVGWLSSQLVKILGPWDLHTLVLTMGTEKTNFYRESSIEVYNDSETLNYHKKVGSPE